MLIFQLYHDIAPELVVLGEYRYHGDFEKSVISIPSS